MSARTTLAALLLATATAAHAETARGGGAAELLRAMAPDRADLAEFRWQARPVLIFAPSPDDPRYRSAVHDLETRRDALAERDIVVLTDTDPAAGGRLRDALGARDFRMILVGKDGGRKMDEAAPIPADRLFAEIDAMPMRRSEMREDGSN